MAQDKPIADLIAERLSAYVGASADTLHKVKFGRGAVGKIAVIIAIAVMALGAVAVRIGGSAALVIAGGLVLVTLAGLGVIFYIVIARPELAVLEGAELVMYKHVTLGAKGMPPIAMDAFPSTFPVMQIPDGSEAPKLLTQQEDLEESK